MSEKRETPSLLLPLLLITAGAALLLQQTGMYTIPWGHIARLWPLLLVLFGLEALFRALKAPALVASSAALVITLVGGLIFEPILYPAQNPGQVSYLYQGNGAETAELYLQASAATVTVDTELNEGMIAVDISDPEGVDDISTQEERSDNTLIVRVNNQRTRVNVPLVDEETTAQWRTHIAADAPSTLVVETGAGKIDVDMSEAALSGLNLHTGVGSMNVELPAGDYSADLSCGVGKIVLTLPENAAVRIYADSGLGNTTANSHYQLVDGYYVSAAFSESAPFATITISTGIGSIVLQ